MTFSHRAPTAWRWSLFFAGLMALQLGDGLLYVTAARARGATWSRRLPPPVLTVTAPRKTLNPGDSPTAIAFDLTGTLPKDGATVAVRITQSSSDWLLAGNEVQLSETSRTGSIELAYRDDGTAVDESHASVELLVTPDMTIVGDIKWDLSCDRRRAIPAKRPEDTPRRPTPGDFSAEESAPSPVRPAVAGQATLKDPKNPRGSVVIRLSFAIPGALPPKQRTIPIRVTAITVPVPVPVGLTIRPIKGAQHLTIPATPLIIDKAHPKGTIDVPVHDVHADGSVEFEVVPSDSAWTLSPRIRASVSIQKDQLDSDRPSLPLLVVINNDNLADDDDFLSTLKSLQRDYASQLAGIRVVTTGGLVDFRDLASLGAKHAFGRGDFTAPFSELRRLSDSDTDPSNWIVVWKSGRLPEDDPLDVAAPASRKVIVIWIGYRNTASKRLAGFAGTADRVELLATSAQLRAKIQELIQDRKN